MRTISITWCIDDVKNIREDLTDDQCYAVLLAADRHHDANIGINWEVLQVHADILFPIDE